MIINEQSRAELSQAFRQGQADYLANRYWPPGHLGLAFHSYRAGYNLERKHLREMVAGRSVFQLQCKP